VVYEEYKSMNEAILLTFDFLKKNNIKNATYLTSPYNTYRLHKFLESKRNDIVAYIYQSKNLPRKNNFFERSLNKKEIFYEYLSIVYNKIQGNF
jgi:hypoxanthine phosphoribosyltransferase